MSNKIFYCSFIILLICYSCTRNKVTPHLSTSNKNITFDIGYPVQHGKVFKDNRGREYIAFADLTTHKSISIFTLQGKKMNTISLQNIMKTHLNLSDFTPISIDSIALLSQYTNKVYIINQKGKLIFSKDYSSLLIKKSIELYKPLYWINGKLLTSIEFQPNKDSLSLKEYQKESNQFYKLFIENTPFDSTNYSLKINNFYNRFTKDGDLAPETQNFIFSKENTLTFSIYCDSIYVYDSNYQLKKTIKVKSKYFNLNLRPVPISVYNKNPDIFTKVSQTHNSIWKIYYDYYRNIYYCIIRGKRISHNHFPFSIIIYDENFNKLNEQKFNSKFYLPNGFVGKSGFYLRLRRNNVSQEKYKLFNYVE